MLQTTQILGPTRHVAHRAVKVMYRFELDGEVIEGMDAAGNTSVLSMAFYASWDPLLSPDDQLLGYGTSLCASALLNQGISNANTTSITEFCPGEFITSIL